VSPHPKDIKGFQLLDEIGAKALTDTNYRRRLLDDPKSVLRKGGLEIPDDVEVVIHRNRPNLVHLVLPEALVEVDRLDVTEVRVAMLSRHTF
jgi:nitrile hydratase alpha subunit